MFLNEKFKRESLRFSSFTTDQIEKNDNELKGRIHDKRHTRPIYVFCLKNQLIGYITGCMRLKPENGPETAELENLFVRNGFRGGGRGTKLVKKFTKWCLKQNVKLILAYTFEQDSEAVRFYKKLGFEGWKTSDRPVHLKFSLSI